MAAALLRPISIRSRRFGAIANIPSLANFVPDNVEHLRDAVIESVGDLHWDERLKRSFFQTAELPL